jgi:hypothetical protein
MNKSLIFLLAGLIGFSRIALADSKPANPDKQQSVSEQKDSDRNIKTGKNIKNKKDKKIKKDKKEKKDENDRRVKKVKKKQDQQVWLEFQPESLEALDRINRK